MVDFTWEVDINSADQQISVIRNPIIHHRIEYFVIRDHLCVQIYYMKYISDIYQIFTNLCTFIAIKILHKQSLM